MGALDFVLGGFGENLGTLLRGFGKGFAAALEDFGRILVFSVGTPALPRSALVRRSVDDDGQLGVEKTGVRDFWSYRLRISLSGTKCDAEVDFDVRSAITSPKPY